MRRQIPIILALAATSLLLACGGSGSANDPASPFSSATNNGFESGAGPSSAAAGIVGTVSALTGACPSVKFALEGKTISTSAETRYEGGACAAVKNGSRVKVAGAVQSNGSVAAQVIGFVVTTTPTAPKDPATPSTAAIKGTVSELAGSCPTVSLKLEGRKITTTATTRYEGGACADLKNGALISVTGTVQADGSIVALSVGIATPTPVAPTEPKPTPTAPSAVAIKGTVNELAGSCPTVSLKLEGRKITTAATTRYEGGACADLKNGALISVTGTVQTDGSVVALSVGIAAATPVTPTEPKPTPTTATVSVKGTVNDFAGSCPAVSFKLEGKKVITSAATRYENGVCADVKSGVVVAVTGTVQVDGSILAVVVSVSK